MKKFRFKSNRHLYEDDAASSNVALDTKQSQSTQLQLSLEEEKTPTNGKPLADNEQYMKIVEYQTQLDLKYSQDKASQQKQIDAAVQAAANDTTSLCEYDHVETNVAVINARLKMLEIQHTYDTAKYTNEKKKLQLCQLLAQEVIERARKEILPDKLVNISEDSLEKHKIYLNNIIGEYRPITSVDDMYNVMSETTLAYGYDRYGMFAICLDSDDINMLHNRLVESGYSVNQVVDTIQPQLYS